MLQPGIKASRQVKVCPANTARTVGSGTLDVFATPAMMALIEETSWRAVAPYLEEGQGTVGILLNVAHSAPTPLGMTVTCEVELTAVEGRKLTFKVNVQDEKTEIGSGVHERFIVDNQKFQAKANKKAEA